MNNENRRGSERHGFFVSEVNIDREEMMQRRYLKPPVRRHAIMLNQHLLAATVALATWLLLAFGLC